MAVNNSIKAGPLGFLVINVYNHGEHYETPIIDKNCRCIRNTTVVKVKYANTAYSTHGLLVSTVKANTAE